MMICRCTRRNTGLKKNLNYVPWMTLLGLVGAGIGALIGRGGLEQREFIFPLYGLCIGSMLGVGVRIMVRRMSKDDKNHR